MTRQVKLIRQDLINALRAEVGLSERKADEVVRVIFDVMARALRRGEQVHTPIGSFKRCRESVGFVNEVLEGASRTRRPRLIRRRGAIRFVPGGSMPDFTPD